MVATPQISCIYIWKLIIFHHIVPENCPLHGDDYVGAVDTVRRATFFVYEDIVAAGFDSSFTTNDNSAKRRFHIVTFELIGWVGA